MSLWYAYLVFDASIYRNIIINLYIASAHHQETWDPNWNLRTLVLSLRGFMTSQAREIGGISTPRSHQIQLAEISRHYICSSCGLDHSSLLGLSSGIVSEKRYLSATDSLRSQHNMLPRKSSISTSNASIKTKIKQNKKESSSSTKMKSLLKRNRSKGAWSMVTRELGKALVALLLMLSFVRMWSQGIHTQYSQAFL
jgi:hypothetical protein